MIRPVPATEDAAPQPVGRKVKSGHLPPATLLALYEAEVERGNPAAAVRVQQLRAQLGMEE